MKERKRLGVDSVLMVDHAIETENLTKVYSRKKQRPNERLSFIDRFVNPVFHSTLKDKVVALNEVNLTINKGELFGLLGPNGAGKTTFVKILCTLLLPTSGTAYVNNFDVRKEASKVKMQIGAVLDLWQGWYPRLTGRQNMKFFADLHLIPSSEVTSRINDALQITGMSEKADDWYQKLSTGEKRRLDIARAILPDSPILLLDEPTIGLDVVIAHEIREFIMNELCKKQGKTALLTTHNMYEADEICDRIAIINEGQIVACDRPEKVKGLVQASNIVEMTIAHASQNVIARLKQLDGVTQLSETVTDPTTNTATLRVHITNSWDEVVPTICETIIKAKGKILSLTKEQPTLEDAFIQLTGSKLKK